MKAISFGIDFDMTQMHAKPKSEIQSISFRYVFRGQCSDAKRINFMQLS